jgi:hypothetical protein
MGFIVTSLIEKPRRVSGRVEVEDDCCCAEDKERGKTMLRVTGAAGMKILQESTE